MKHPTPYGKAEDLALENERLRATLRKLKAAAGRVRALHVNTHGTCAHCTRGKVYPVPWPCETVNALDIEGP